MRPPWGLPAAVKNGLRLSTLYKKTTSAYLDLRPEPDPEEFKKYQAAASVASMEEPTPPLAFYGRVPIHLAASCAMGGFHSAEGRSADEAGTTELPSSTPPQTSLPNHQNRRYTNHMPRPNKYLDELISYGGAPFTRAEVIADMQRTGTSQPLIDRWLHGQEHASRLHHQRQLLTLGIFVPEPTRRTRKLCR